MFSGIVEEVGKILQASDTGDGRRLRIGSKAIVSDLKIGDSVNISGTCQTVVDCDSSSFQVESTLQTLSCTKLGSLKVSDAVNLERALRVSDRLGGHLVTGHTDSVAEVISIVKEGFSNRITFTCDAQLMLYLVEKGSVAIDGVSLTVFAVGDSQPVSNQQNTFTVALIPHTGKITTLGALKVGDKVNIEVDPIAKYAAKWMAPTLEKNLKNAGLSMSFLSEHGYT